MPCGILVPPLGCAISSCETANTSVKYNSIKQMNKLQPTTTVALAAALLFAGAAGVQAAGHVYDIPAVTSGTWNDKGVHQSGTGYQIGYNAKSPNEQAAYIEFNLTPAKGKTVTAAGTLVIGSTDYDIEAYWPNPDNNLDGNTHTQFKVGTRPQGSPTLSEILTGNNNISVYNDGPQGNSDLGYGWTPNGLHPGYVFDAFHYESTGQVGPALQNAVNAGGDYILWYVDRFDLLQDGDPCPVNYIWGSTSYTSAILLEITTSN